MLRKIGIGIIIVTLTITMFKLGEYLKKLKYFEITELDVTGNNVLSKNRIIRISGIKSGDNIFSFNIKKAKKKLEGYRLISSAYIRRNLPDRVLIKIEERKPVAILNLGRKGLIEIDSKGYIIGSGSKITDWNIPVITGFKIRLSSGMKRIKSESFDRVLSTIRTTKEKFRDLYDILSEINLKTKKGNLDGDMLILYLAGYRVKIIAKPMIKAEKIEELIAILMYYGTNLKSLDYIDLRFESPIVKGGGFN